MKKEKRKNKGLTHKAEESDYGGDMYLIIKNFKRFLKNEKNKNEDK